tara:strand:+ start:14823 stop:18149 length:3327 start_codon:yes stop_codon:yes gene_type:complete
MAIVNSAYTQRFESYFKSTNERDWVVQIWDRAYVGGSSQDTFEITDNGLTIQFDSDGDEKFAPIVGSKALLNFMVDYDSPGHASFIDDLLGLGTTYIEGDIFITIREGSITGPLIFCGEYLQDLDTLPDVDGPFPIQLTFTDGIGKLKEITFESLHVDTTAVEYKLQGHQKFSYWIGQIIQHTKFYKTQANPDGFWDDATNKGAFSTCCRWWNADMYYAPNSASKFADPLQQTKGTMKWTDKFNPSNGQRNIQNAYEVLKAICKSWGMRVICWTTTWRFYQIYEMNNVNVGTWTNPIDMDRYRYYADGSINDQRTSLGFTKWDRFNNRFYNVSHPGARIQKLEGGKYKFLPVLNEVKVNLVHEGFQNIFGGIPTGNAFGTNGMSFVNGPFTNSSQYKFNTNFYIEVTAPNGAWVTNYTLTQVSLRIIAMPPGASSIASGLATLTYDPVANTYGWDDTPTYTGSDLGPVINHYSLGGSYPGLGATSVIPLGPNLAFPGYRDADTDYWITTGSPIYATNQSGTLINIQTGSPYGSSYIFPSWTNPIDTSALAPPSWSTGVFNNFLSVIQPVSNNSSTTNTIFVNNQTDDSHKLDWGNIYWGDGPEYWDDSALMVQTGASTYEFADWTSEDWVRRDQTQSTPISNSGRNFTDLLTLQMKQCQQRIIRRANFKTANSPEDMWYLSKPFFVNPIGAINDIFEDSSGANQESQYMFRRGKFNMINNQWEGEWIETITGALSGGSSSARYAGGTNLTGTGGTNAGLMSRRGGAPNTRTRLTLAVGTQAVVKDVAITSITIENGFASELTNETDFPIGTSFNLKTNDKLWMVFVDGSSYELTLTADVTSESTNIQFASITPTTSSGAIPIFQIPMLKLYENMYRKTDGKIAGFDVNATSLTKGGISIDGFLDSDSMTGASATTLPTSESVKAYVDSQSGGGGGLSNYSMLTCSGTTTTSSTSGEANAVVIPFNTKLDSTTNSITLYTTTGPSSIANGVYSWTMGGSPPDGYFEMSWNIGVDTNIVNNRILTGFKLQKGTISRGTIVWTDVNGSHGYIYDRGTGSVRKGSGAGSVIERLTGELTIYFRLVVWKESSSNASTTSITLTNASQISIKEI